MTQVRMIQYIHHQAVIRKDKSTSKLRIVYNASAKTTSVLSLIILAPVWAEHYGHFAQVSCPFLLNARVNNYIEKYRGTDPIFADKLLSEEIILEH